MSNVHVTQRILDAVRVLLTALPTTAGRVHDGLDADITKLRDTDTPALWFVRGADNPTPVAYGSAGPVYERRLDIVIKALVQQQASRSATLNQMVLEVEQALESNPTLGGLTRCCFYKGSPEPVRYDDLQKPVCELSMTFEYTYFTSQGTPWQTL